MDEKATELLTGFDRALDHIEAMPVTAAEKKRLVREWLRSRLAEAFKEVPDGGEQTSR